jgi:hypothetical protein
MEEAVKRILNPLVVRMRFEGGDRVFQPVGLDSRESIEKHVLSQILESFDYGEIADQVFRLKSLLLLGKSVTDIDTLISEILEFESVTLVKEGMDKEMPRPHEGAEQKTVQRMDEKDKEVEESEEEVWDWRRAYALGSKARKR